MGPEIKKKILIITPHLAPENHAAVFRTHKLIKYLPDRGWDVFVLAPDRNYEYKTSSELLEEIPSSVRVYRTPYIEPSLRGLKEILQPTHMITSMDADSIQVGRAKTEDTTTAIDMLKEPLRASYANLLHNTLYQPDRYRFWKKTALKKARQILQEESIDLVFTSSLPFTTLEIGLELKKKFSVKWVSDQRDPLTYTQKHFSSNPTIYLRQKDLELLSLQKADAITTLTSVHQMIFADMYGTEHLSKVHFIPTGVDDEYVPKSSGPKQNRLIYGGEFLKDYGDEFFKVLGVARTLPGWDETFRLEFIGNTDINKTLVENEARRFGVADLIEFTDQVSQEVLYNKLITSQGAVLSVSRNFPWWCCFAKLVDYIGLAVPVVALVPDPSEARKWLTKTGLGTFLDGSSEQNANLLLEFLSRKSPIELSEEQETVRRRFLASSQVKSFEDIFLKLLSVAS